MKKRTTLLVLLLLALLPAVAQRSRSFTIDRHHFVDTVKVEILDGAVIVPVEIEGKVRRLMFDTGAENGFWIAGEEEWMKSSGDSVMVIDSQNKRIRLPILKIPSIKMGSITLEDYPVMVHDAMSGVVCGMFDGALGYDLVAKGLSFKLDTKDSMMIVTDRRGFFAKEEKGQPTLKYREKTLPLVFVGFPFANVKMLFDLGWVGGWFDLPEYWLNRWSANNPKMRQTLDELTVRRDTIVSTQYGLSGRVNDTLVERTLHIPEVKMEGLTLNDVWVSTGTFSVKVGSAILKHNSLIINASKRKLILLPNNGKLEQEVGNEKRGISFIPAEEGDTIGAVKAVVGKGTTAYSKGLRTGDYLISINGIPITEVCAYVTISSREKVVSSVFRSPDGTLKEVEWLRPQRER